MTTYNPALWRLTMDTMLAQGADPALVRQLAEAVVESDKAEGGPQDVLEAAEDRAGDLLAAALASRDPLRYSDDSPGAKQ